MLDETVTDKQQAQTNAPQADYLKLRSLLLGDDYEAIIKQRLKLSDTQRVTEVISEAFHERNQKDDTLAAQMAPVIESSIDSSIRNNPSRITNVIFPIMGPAVRKAVASALSDMITSLNHLLQQSLSAKALVWRFNAWRSGMSYGQYVLLKSLQYRVEQVFLIHRESGLLIHSCVADNVTNQDPDLVSAMLTAITDFVSDSFNAKSQEAELNVIQFGQLSLLIETGPSAILAFVVRGNVTVEIREHLLELIEELHLKYSSQLAEFDGQTDTEIDEQLLKQALIEKEKTPSQTKPWLAISALSILLVAMVYYIFIGWQQKKTINHVLDTLKEQPGYLLLSNEFTDNNLTIELLRSPSSISLDEIRNRLPEIKFNLSFHEHFAPINDSELFITTLQNKYSAKLHIVSSDSGKTLSVEGVISKDNLLALERDPVVKSLFSQLDLSNTVISSGLTEKQQFESEFKILVDQLNHQAFFFEAASKTLTADSQKSLNQVIINLQRLLSLQAKAELKVLQISISGFADTSGTSQINQNLSEQRARLIADIFKANDINQSLIISWGLGTRDLPQVPEQLQRRVSLNVIYGNLENFKQ